MNMITIRHTIKDGYALELVLLNKKKNRYLQFRVFINKN
jgi:hypothetical protein